MPILSRSNILDAEDNAPVEIPVPEWGGVVLVRALTGKERDSFEQTMISMKGGAMSMKLTNVRARLVSLGCVDEQGKRLFTLADVELLGRKNARALDRLATKIQELSGLSNVDLKDLTANFTVDPSDDSTFDSHLHSEE